MAIGGGGLWIYHSRSPLTTEAEAYVIATLLIGINFFRGKLVGILKFAGFLVVAITVVGCCFLVGDILLPPNMEPPQGRAQQALAANAAQRLGYSRTAAEQNLLRYHELSHPSSVRMSVEGNSFAHNEAIKIHIRNDGSQATHITFPAGRVFEPTDGALVQNLVLKNALSLTVDAGESRTYSTYGFCGNRKFDPPPPRHPMKETSFAVNKGLLSDQASIWYRMSDVATKDRDGTTTKAGDLGGELWVLVAGRLLPILLSLRI
jgi:hypothetical protein